MILISGASRGFGRFLARRYVATHFDRSAPLEQYRHSHFEAVIHCAFNPQRDVGMADLYRYLDDNTLLTQRLASLRCDRFIYLSTVDVYPRDGRLHRENDAILLSQQDSAYGITKFLSEAIVRNAAPDHLILRPTGMLGDCIRPTTVTRLLSEADPTLTLSADAILNFVDHSDVGELIESALKDDLCGTFNVAAQTNVTLGALADALNVRPKYGSVFYDIGLVDNSAASAIVPALKRTSLEKITSFAERVRSGLVTLADPVGDDRR